MGKNIMTTTVSHLSSTKSHPHSQTPTSKVRPESFLPFSLFRCTVPSTPHHQIPAPTAREHVSNVNLTPSPGSSAARLQLSVQQVVPSQMAAVEAMPAAEAAASLFLSLHPLSHLLACRVQILTTLSTHKNFEQASDELS